jgi:hypothetical protein
MSGLFKILFSIFYTVSYFFLAILSTGGGHGNFIFLAPVFTWVFLLAAIGISGKLDIFLVRIFFIFLMLLHYAHILIFIKPVFSEGFDPETLKVWQNQPQSILFVTAWYLIGQSIVWLMFYKEIKNHQKAEGNSLF